MKVASIDIGTNSVLLLVADKYDDEFKVLHEIQELPRLGEGVDKDRRLGIESQKRVIDVLKSYKSYLSQHFPEVVAYTAVTATSAVRDASNRNLFLSSVLSETGWDIRLLTGDEESQTTYKGALSVLNASSNENYVVLDIGGGSTEIANGKGLNFANGISIDMGSVRYSERFFHKSGVDLSIVNIVREEVRKNYDTTDSLLKPFKVIGVAGTVTTIAAVSSGLKEYNPNVLNGYILASMDIEKCIDQFIDKTSEEIESINPMYLKGRGDVILAGSIILSEFLNWSKSESLVVSTGGIRHGILV